MSFYSEYDFNLGADVDFVEVTTAALLANKKLKVIRDRLNEIIDHIEGLPNAEGVRHVKATSVWLRELEYSLR